ncbi:MAG: adenylosuccinate synthase [Clostridiales bacterium]|jgi:adenylosuccinate synthase|nr:adenylosuccinate synthase [Clostridiales bacterium]
MLTAIVGINWGDEGKGRMVDLLSSRYDVIVRYQGGNNAGHTVINDRGEFVLNLLPSGVLSENTVNVMGPGMVADIAHLSKEIDALRERGVSVTPENLILSDKAIVCMPYHVTQDILEEERLADKKFGSTRRGIAPAYADKYMKKGLRAGDLLDMKRAEDRVREIVEWKSLTLSGYGKHGADADETLTWLREYAPKITEHIRDTAPYLNDAAESGKNIMFEAQLGALRDIDFGIYPYTTSSQTLASYATTGAGIPARKLDNVIGVVKAYSSCVGEGPFTCEFFGDQAEKLREAGGEYGAATGRPRRVGGFDVVASRYGVQTQGADSVAITKLDVLSRYDKIPVCVAYDLDGEKITRFPAASDALSRAKPIYEFMDGFKKDISQCRHLNDLPRQAVEYVNFIEKSIGCRAAYISVGAKRDEYIEVTA